MNYYKTFQKTNNSKTKKSEKNRMELGTSKKKKNKDEFTVYAMNLLKTSKNVMSTSECSNTLLVFYVMEKLKI